jgi:hypothetical protein
VIATGFESRPELVTERPRAIISALSGNLDIPTVIRKPHRLSELASQPPVAERVPIARPAGRAPTAVRDPLPPVPKDNNVFALEEEEYDVPTFLRRPER